MELTAWTPLLWLLAALPLAWALRTSLVDRPRALRWTATGLRLAAILALAIALCRPHLLRDDARTHHVHLIDISHSIDPAAIASAVDAVEATVGALPSGDTWSLFTLAERVEPSDAAALRTRLEHWQRAERDDDRLRAASRLAAGLRAVRLDFRADRRKAIVLHSDGQATDAELAAALTELQREGIAVRFVPLAGLARDEVALTALTASTTQAFRGEVVRLRAHLTTNGANHGRVRFLRDGLVVAERTFTAAAAGDLSIDADLTMAVPGDLRWQAQVVAERDHFLINNQAAVTVTVRGEPRLLVLHEEPEEMQGFARALREQGYLVEVRGRFGLPEQLDEMLAFDAICFARIPATLFSQRQMALVRRYVTDFGGGVIMLGSDESYGLGGYYRTPIEEVLPLTSRYEKEQEKPSLAMMLVIDKSGSMDGAPIALARQAARAAVEVLSSRDLIGVAAYDSQAFLVSPLRSAADAIAIGSAIDTIGASGGTSLMPGLMLAREQLLSAPARIKHVIVLGDGQDGVSSAEALLQSVRQMAGEGMTVSTVALGEGADRETFAAMAQSGGGRAYVTLDPASVPQIFTKETMEASNTAIKEDLFTAVQTGDHPLLAGYRAEDLPFVLGYVMTEAKPTAQVLLSAETGDPLLAIGRYGLGHGLAWTADLSERWGSEWLAWSECGRFWAQALRPVLRKADTRGVQVTQRVGEHTWTVDVHYRDEDGLPLDGAAWDVVAITGDGATAPLACDEVGLGRYRVVAPLGAHERLTLRWLDAARGRQVVLHHQRPYPAEYRLGRTVPEALATLRDDTPTHAARSRHPAHHWLVFAAIACALTGILLRRI